MDKKEYLEKLKQAELDYANVKKRLAEEYVRDKYSYQKGDIIQDHLGKVLIEKFVVGGVLNNPTCGYYGVMITKKGEPYKSGEKRYVYEPNIVKGVE